MDRLLCSTGALLGKNNSNDFNLLPDLVRKLNCDAYEFILYSAWEQQFDEVLEVLNGLGTKFYVVHEIKQIGELISIGEKDGLKRAEHFHKMSCEAAKRIGAEKMVLHLWGGLTSDKHFANNLAMYKHFRDIANDYGVEMLVENVVCAVEDPMKRLFQLFEVYHDMNIVFDTKMAAFHEQLEKIYGGDVRWLWKDGHIKHLHINDYNGGYKEWGKLFTLPVGAGKIDFATFFEFLNEVKYDGRMTVEATAIGKDGSVDVDMLNNCFDKIRELSR